MDSKRILIIDDDPTITTLVEGFLEDTGRFTVRAENDGKWGLAAAKEFQPDLVLLDVMMSEIDGGFIASQIKEDETLKGTPIVFLTSAVSKEQVEAKGGIIGGNRFLAKPVDPDELIDCIDQSIKDR
ncbi:MAG: PleD family two-component system response regulator [Acidobacteriota bacterium]